MDFSIAERVGNRYDEIIAYFVRHPLGSHPPDMTILSLLPPVDRCLILERLFCLGAGNLLDLVDKLSMAYLKAGWPNLANDFVAACVRGGWIIPEHGAFFRDKLAGLYVHGVSGSYRDTLRKLSAHEVMSPHFANLLRALCETYAGREIFAGLSDLRVEDRFAMTDFLAERQAFVRDVGSSR